MKKSDLKQIIREEIQKVFDEQRKSQLDEAFELTPVAMLLLPFLAAKLGSDLGMLIAVATDADVNIIQSIKDWWKSRKDDKAMNKIADRLKNDPEVQYFVDPKNQNKRGWRKMLATKLTPQEQEYIKSLYKSRFKNNISEGSVKNLQLEFSEIVSQILGKEVEVQMSYMMDTHVLIVKNEQLKEPLSQDIEDEFNYQTNSNAEISGHQIKGADTIFILD